MSRLTPAVFLATLAIAALPLSAQVALEPLGVFAPLPGGHGYIIGLEVSQRRVFLFTDQETYSSAIPHVPAHGWQKIWDLTPFNLFLYEESLVVINPTNPNHYYFTGGITGNRLVVFQQSPITVMSNTVIGSLQSIPAGMVLRNPAAPGGAAELFYSINGTTGDSPALYRHADVASTPWTSQNAFGTSGAGQVTSGVGALRFGTDGLLNVLDTGGQRIIRYNPDTLAYVSEFALGNTNTDKNAFIVTPSGHVFTAFTDSAGGAIYDYTTGEQVGTYGSATIPHTPGLGLDGKTSMTFSRGRIYVFNSLPDGSEGVFVYDAYQVIAGTETTSITGNTVDLNDQANPRSNLIAFASGATGSLVNSNTSAAVKFFQTVSIDAGATAQVGGAGDLTLFNMVSGTGSLKKVGGGTLTLDGSNTYSGATIVAAGTLAFDAPDNLGDGSATNTIELAGGTLRSTGSNNGSGYRPGPNRSILVTANSTFQSDNGELVVEGSTHLAGNLTITGTGEIEFRGVVSGTGGFIKTGTGILHLASETTFTGETVIAAGSVVAYEPGSLRYSTVVLNAGGGTLDIGYFGQTTLGGLRGDGNLYAPGSTLIVGENSGSSVYSGVLSGPAGLIKSGGGTLTFSGNNLYAGGTTVLSGSLIVNGSLASPLVNVVTGATLGGSGTFDGLVSLQSGAHLAPGNSPGTLTFTNGLTLTDGSILDFELGASSDLIRVSGGTLTGSALADGITVNLSYATGFTADTYTLFNFDGATLAGFDASDFAIGTGLAGYDYIFNLTDTTLQLVVTTSAIPEPSTYAILAGLGAMGWVLLRRKKTTA